jgi:hypothetical protein
MTPSDEGQGKNAGTGDIIEQYGTGHIGKVEGGAYLLPYLLTAAHFSALAAGLRLYFRRHDGKQVSVEQDGSSYTLKGLSAKEAEHLLVELRGISKLDGPGEVVPPAGQLDSGES